MPQPNGSRLGTSAIDVLRMDRRAFTSPQAPVSRPQARWIIFLVSHLQGTRDSVRKPCLSLEGNQVPHQRGGTDQSSDDAEEPSN